MANPCQLIVYACPVGPLAEQLEQYFSQSRTSCGPNTAHRYMPHCSLTGFFRDDPATVPYYVERLDQCYHKVWTGAVQPRITVQKLAFKSNWHGLSLHSPTLKQLIRTFIKTSSSPTCPVPIRAKAWLHLSLAYDFQSNQAKPLERLARQWVDPTAAVQWELRLYRRNAGNSWLCYHQWLL